MLPPRRALALAAAVLLFAGSALAQEVGDDVDRVEDQTPTEQLGCEPPLGSCLPDLMPTNPRARASDERFPATLCTDFINVGSGPTATPFRILLSLDEVGYGERQASDIYQRGQGEADLCWTNVSLPRGIHYMTIKVDSNEEILESNETNNVRTIRFYVGPTPLPDLHLTQFTVTPREGGKGDVQLFIANITNAGTARSAQTTVHLEDDNGMVVEWPVPALEPRQTTTLVHATRPESRPVGTWYARAMVDPSDTLDEAREDNNEKLLEYVVLEHPAPDYIIQNLTIQGNLSELRGVRVDATVKNVGDRAVQGTTVRLVNDSNVIFAHGYTRSIIYPNQSSTIQFILGLRAGDYQLRAVADPTLKVAERNETNNEWPFDLTIESAPVVQDLPNLVVERVFAMPEDPRPGELVSLGAVVHNIGTNRSNATSLSFSIEGTTLATAAVPALAPGAYHSAYVPWTGGDTGTYSIVAEADPASGVAELEESDNALALDFLITRERPPSEQPPPITPPPPTPTTPTPTPPTTPTPTTPTPTTPSVVIGDLIMSTKEGPEGARGVISLSLRNPSIQPLGLLTVTFKVDGKVVKDVLVQGIRGAATTAATTGEIDIPAGTHKATAEVRIVGTTSAPQVREYEYTQESGKNGLPGFTPAAAVGALALVVLLRRGRRER